MEDGEGNRSTFIYDDFDRVFRLEYPVTTVGAHLSNASDYEEYGYDANDNPTTKLTRSGGLFTTSFDNLNRISAIDAPTGSNDVWYGYDNLNRRLYASHAAPAPNPLCGTVTATCMTWDALGRQITDQQALGTMTMAYDLAGRRTHLFYPDAFEIRYGYDLDDSLRTVTQAGLTTIANFAYDDLARRTSVTRGNGVTTSYTYDGASRLRTLGQDAAGTGADVTWTFSYNPASQVFVRQTSNSAYLYAPAAGAQAITRNGLNQPTAVNSVATSSDARGNLTFDGVKGFTFDSANRLTGTGSSTLSYDPLDRLGQMVGATGGRYLYDGDEIAGVVTAPTGTTINNRIIRGPWPDELLVAYQGSTASTPLWSLQDHQNSVIAITDASGNASFTLGYDEYGQPRSGNAGRLMYTGQLWLPDFGLYHYKTRAYHPGLGRFMQTDPVGYEQGMNLYAYVGLDPMNVTDPSGMIGCKVCDQIVEGAQDLAERARGVVDHMWGTGEDPGTARMTANWVTGQGPDNLEFGPDSINTQELMASSGVAAARDFLYDKYDGAPPDGGGVSNYAVKFGLEGYATSRTAAEQFVGSFRVDISVSDGRANFTVTNNSSFRSFAYGVAPAWERSSFRPMGNMRQTYRWSEPVVRRRQ